jgi:hypothetical protein
LMIPIVLPRCRFGLMLRMIIRSIVEAARGLYNK